MEKGGATKSDAVPEVEVKDPPDMALLGNNELQDDAKQLQISETSASSATGLLPLMRQNWPLMLLTWLTQVCMGMASSLPGSSLMQLASQVDVSISTIGFWFTVKSATSCLSAVATGVLFVRLPAGAAGKATFMAAWNLVSAVAMMVTALARSCGLVLCLAGLLGAGHGALDTANSILAIRVFGSRHSRPILHSLQLCTALGGLAAPLLLHAFADSGDVAAASAADANATDATWLNSGGSVTCGGSHGGGNDSTYDMTPSSSTPPFALTSQTTAMLTATSTRLQLLGPYSVLVALQAAVSAGFLLTAARRCSLADIRQAVAPSAAADTDTVAAASLQRPPLPAWRRRVLVALTVAFYFAVVGAENIFCFFISAYGVCSPTLQLEPPAAAGLHAAFFAGFFAGRCLGVVTSRWARPVAILLVHLTGCLAALIALCLGTALPWLTFVSTAAFGAFVSVLYATGVTWLEQRLTVAGPLACTFLIGGQLGISVLSLLAGHLLVSPVAGPDAVPRLALVTFAAATVVFLLMMAVAGEMRLPRRRRAPRVPPAVEAADAAPDGRGSGRSQRSSWQAQGEL